MLRSSLLGHETRSPSTFQRNVQSVLSSLSSNANQSDGFYNTTAGYSTDTVWGIFQCLSHATVQNCQKCVSDGVKDIIQRCPNQKGAVSWYDNCWIHFSGDMYFFNKMEDEPKATLANTGSATDTTSFMNMLRETLGVVAEEASNGGRKKFATKENHSAFEPLYTLAQCTPDITGSDCRDCLDTSITDLRKCCNGKVGAVALKPSCYLRYDTFAFYQALPSRPPPAPSKDKSKISAGTTIAIIVPTVIFILQLSLFFLCLKYWRARMNSSSVPKTDETSSAESLHFDLDEIKSATNDFSPDNKLGQGGYGEVYKGILPNRQELAVKRLSSSSKQGAPEFKNEVVTMAKLQHRNLVRFLGFCLEEEEKILVYEFLPNKSLDNFLFGTENKGKLNWTNRYKIIEGIARGILYLHDDSQLKIIHRDLKSSNVLLDDYLNPKISDFGMARIFEVDQTQANTSKVVGTFGYMAPEYAMHGHISVKIDIYSFGVLILEIISGKKNTSFYASNYAENLLTYAWKLWREGTPLELLDPSLRNSCSENEVIKCIHMSLLCIQENPALRPTIQFIMLMLSSHSVTLSAPQQPAFLFDVHRTDSNNQPSFENSSDQSPSKSMQRSANKDPISDVYPR
ncbi:hypothetical protein K1719_005326 [Acacia pycnantha]|nr:hypothetical protein K1719_005326 [Acacia pycnantha]